MNKYQNVRVFPCALGDFDGETGFDPGLNSETGHMAAGGPLRVSCSRADTLLAAGEVEAPDLIKIDVEGAEENVLRGACGAMERRPVLFLATHSARAHRACLELLAVYRYKVHALDGGPPEGTDEVVAVASSEVAA